MKEEGTGRRAGPRQNSQVAGGGAPLFRAVIIASPCLGMSTASTMTVSSELMALLTAGGLSRAGAAGVVGNFSQESSLNPAESGGYLGQWTGTRLAAEQSYASQHGESPTSVAAEGGFTLSELGSSYPQLLQELKTTTNPQQAALDISSIYERPLASAANNPNREAQALAAYQSGAGGSSSGGGGQSLLSTIGTGAGAAVSTTLGVLTGGLVGNDPIPNPLSGVEGDIASAAATAAEKGVEAVIGDLISTKMMLTAVLVFGGMGMATYGVVRLVGAHPGADAARVAGAAAPFAGAAALA